MVMVYKQFHVLMLYICVRSYSDGRYAMSDSERSQLDKFFEKSVLYVVWSSYSFA